MKFTFAVAMVMSCSDDPDVAQLQHEQQASGHRSVQPFVVSVVVWLSEIGPYL